MVGCNAETTNPPLGSSKRRRVDNECLRGYVVRCCGFETAYVGSVTELMKRMMSLNLKVGWCHSRRRRKTYFCLCITANDFITSGWLQIFLLLLFRALIFKRGHEHGTMKTELHIHREFPDNNAFLHQLTGPDSSNSMSAIPSSSDVQLCFLSIDRFAVSITSKEQLYVVTTYFTSSTRRFAAASAFLNRTSRPV